MHLMTDISPIYLYGEAGVMPRSLADACFDNITTSNYQLSTSVVILKDMFALPLHGFRAVISENRAECVI